MVNEEVHQGVEVLWKEVIVIMGPAVSGEREVKTDGKESPRALGVGVGLRRWVSEWSSVHVIECNRPPSQSRCRGCHFRGCSAICGYFSLLGRLGHQRRSKMSLKDDYKNLKLYSCVKDAMRCD